MNYKIKGVNAEEMRFKINPVKPASNKIEIKPLFKRQLKNSNLNENEKLVNLTVTIESTADCPQIFDLYVSFIAVYDVYDCVTKEDLENFVTHATQELYNYIRNAVTMLTGTANIMPFMLPVTPPYFPLN